MLKCFSRDSHMQRVWGTLQESKASQLSPECKPSSLGLSFFMLSAPPIPSRWAIRIWPLLIFMLVLNCNLFSKWLTSSFSSFPLWSNFWNGMFIRPLLSQLLSIPRSTTISWHLLSLYCFAQVYRILDAIKSHWSFSLLNLWMAWTLTTMYFFIHVCTPFWVSQGLFNFFFLPSWVFLWSPLNHLHNFTPGLMLWSCSP